MTTLAAAPPPPLGALDALIRTRHSGGAVRVYVDADLIGTLVRRRHRPPTGRASNRWFATPAAMAYTGGVIGARPPAAAAAGVELTQPCVTRHAAIVLLVTHLRATGSPAVAPLYA